MLSKKSRNTIAAFVAGAFIIAGIAGPLAAQAESTIKECPAYHQHHQIKPEQAAKRLARTYGLDESLILKYQSQGKTPRELNRAALYAKASGTSFESVVALKTSTNTWQDVANTLGVDKTRIKAIRQDLAATRMSQRFNIAQTEIQDLFNQGYHHRDIAMSGMLAKQTGKTIADVIAMKKVNNTWRDVAKELGVDLNALKKDMKKAWESKKA